LYVRVRGARIRAQAQDVLSDQTVDTHHIDSVENYGDWSSNVLVYPRAKRNVLNLFHNPDVNIALANQNLVEHLASDLQQLSEQVDPKSLVSYQLVNRFVRYWIPINFLRIQDQALEYRFEIRLRLNSPQIKARMLERLRKERMQNGDALFDLPPGEEMHILMISPIMNFEDPTPLNRSGGSGGPEHSFLVATTQNLEGATQNIPTSQSTDLAAPFVTLTNKSSAWSLSEQPHPRLQAFLIQRGQS